jgi:hypothetical protein
VFFDNGVATGGTQFVELRIDGLFVGGDTRVADQAGGDGGFAGFWRHHVASGSCGCPILQFNRVFTKDRL